MSCIRLETLGDVTTTQNGNNDRFRTSESTCAAGLSRSGGPVSARQSQDTQPQDTQPQIAKLKSSTMSGMLAKFRRGQGRSTENKSNNNMDSAPASPQTAAVAEIMCNP